MTVEVQKPEPEEDGPNKLPCPRCKRVGGLKWDHTTRAFRCHKCHTSGIRNLEYDARGKKTEPQKEKIDDALQAVDRYLDKHGHPQTVIVDVPKIDDELTPTLWVDENRCAFARWRLASVIANEKRWGRDNLRQRGFKVVSRTTKNGEPVKVYDQERTRRR